MNVTHMKRFKGETVEKTDRSQTLLGVLIRISLAAALPGTVLAANPPGFSQLQGDTADGVLATCGGFVANPYNLNSNEQELFDVCTSMVNNNKVVTGDSTADNTSRGLNESELAAGYQNLATEETLSPVRIGTNATTGQALTILTRAQQLRGGNAFGFNPYQNGQYATNNSVAGGNAGDTTDMVVGKLGGFVTPFGGFGDTANTARTAGSDFSNVGFTAGVDYRITDNLIFGLAGGYSHLDLDYRQNVNVAGGSVDADTGTFSAYGTFYEGDFYIDTLFNYGWANYDIDRRVVVASNNTTVAGSAPINATAKGNTDGTQWTFSLQSGYDFHTDALSYGPYVKVNYTKVQTDAYTETGAGGLNLLVHKQLAESVQSVVGGQIRYAFSQSFGVILPYLRFDWVHEFRDPSRTLSAQYVNDPRNNLLVAFSDNPDRNYFNLNTGVSTVLPDGIQAYFNYNTILDNDLISGHLFSIGARMEF